MYPRRPCREEYWTPPDGHETGRDRRSAAMAADDHLLLGAVAHNPGDRSLPIEHVARRHLRGRRSASGAVRQAPPVVSMATRSGVKAVRPSGDWKGPKDARSRCSSASKLTSPIKPSFP